MLEPLKQFICDTCNQLIEYPEDGWLEWLECFDEKQHRILQKEFRICHRISGCRRHANHADVQKIGLEAFTGEPGMIWLIGNLERGFIPEHLKFDHDYKGIPVLDMREYAELMRRIMLPHYEEARGYFDQAEDDDHFLHVDATVMLTSETLKGIIEKYSSQS
jgi:hypothetical protein